MAAPPVPIRGEFAPAAPPPPSATAIVARAVRVGLYARVSTRDNDQDPDLQLHPMREYAAVRGWQATEYVDHTPAGDLAGRTAWERLLEDARRRRGIVTSTGWRVGGRMT